MTTVQVEVQTIELGGGKLLRVCRSTNPQSGVDRLTLATAWEDDRPGLMPLNQEMAVEFPASVRSDLVDALQSFDDG